VCVCVCVVGDWVRTFFISRLLIIQPGVKASRGRGVPDQCQGYYVRGLGLHEELVYMRTGIVRHEDWDSTKTGVK
jgi:hypothetical protein